MGRFLRITRVFPDGEGPWHKGCPYRNEGEKATKEVGTSHEIDAQMGCLCNSIKNNELREVAEGPAGKEKELFAPCGSDKTNQGRIQAANFLPGREEEPRDEEQNTEDDDGSRMPSCNHGSGRQIPFVPAG